MQILFDKPGASSHRDSYQFSEFGNDPVPLTISKLSDIDTSSTYPRKRSLYGFSFDQGSQNFAKAKEGPRIEVDSSLARSPSTDSRDAFRKANDVESDRITDIGVAAQYELQMRHELNRTEGYYERSLGLS